MSVIFYRVKYLSFFILLLLFYVMTFSVYGTETVLSPDGRIAFSFQLTDQSQPEYRVDFAGKEFLPFSPLGLQTEPPLEDGFKQIEVKRLAERKNWKPLYGERETIDDHWNGLTLLLEEKGKERRLLALDVRVYNGGVAFRYSIPKQSAVAWTIEKELTGFVVPEGTVAWPIFWTEETFPKEPVPVANITKPVFAPMTMQLKNGPFLSLLESAVIDYPRARFIRSENGGINKSDKRTETLAIQTWGKAKLAAPFVTPWRLIMVAEKEANLIENEYLVLNLNLPSSEKNTDWIVPGKTLSNEGNCRIDTDQLKSMVDFAAANRIRYVQIDWGWYGTEWNWSDAECDTWAKTNPDKADDPNWRRNAKGSPFTVAKGLIPYLPTWKSSTVVSLDLPELIRYGKEKGVGICLYVNDQMLKKYDIEKLFAEYEKWGLAGLKPGFVAYGTQKDTNDIRRLVETAARHKLWLCIHDAYLPEGMARTWPNLLTVEGGGGQEGNHPEHHDVVLPFTRCLAGPFDYTPALYVKGKSHAHQLSLLITLYAPTHVLRKGWVIRDRRDELGFGSEREFLREVDSNWLDSKVLDAKIGKHIVIARKNKSGQWQLGATNGKDAYTSQISLSFLDPRREYTMTLWTDQPEAKDGWRPTVKTVRKVSSKDTISLPMSAAGGAVALFR